MRYSEAIRKLEEEPTLMFRLVETYKTWTLKTDYDPRFPNDGSLYFILECEGKNSLGEAGEFSGNLLTADDRWELIRHSVSCIEAIEAWAEGKDISVEVGGRKLKFTHDSGVFNLSVQMINEGNWYVEG